MIGGVPQVIFGGGDGWLYSFKADKGKDGKPELLWKFDINPKDSILELGGRGTRNDIISTPVVYDNKVYFCTGQDPEHGEGVGILWCIDPTKRGDISEKLAVNRADPKKPIPVKRMQAVVEADGDMADRQSEFGRRLEVHVARRQRRRQARLRGAIPPLDQHRGDQERPAVRARFQRPVPLRRCQDRQGATGPTTCWPRPGARR